MTKNQIEYQKLQELKRSNLVSEGQKVAELAESQRSNVARESETTRHNREVEAQALQQIGINMFDADTRRQQSDEARRSNLVKEAETSRHNKATEEETTRHNVKSEELEGHNVNIGWYDAETRRQQAAETARSNVARESETYRHNVETESEAKRSNLANETERNRANRASESISMSRTQAQNKLDAARTETEKVAKQTEVSKRINLDADSNLKRTQEAKTRGDNTRSNVSMVGNILDAIIPF